MKVTIQELKDNHNLVVKITNNTDGNKLISAFCNKPTTMDRFDEGTSIVWYDHNSFSWNFIRDKKINQTIIDFKDVDFNNKLKPRKIIAYECIIEFPKFDLGEKLIAVEWNSDGIPTRINRSGSIIDSYGTCWVENKFAKYWKPIYEEEEIIIKDYKGKFSKGITKFGCKEITLEEINAIKSLTEKLGEFNIQLNGVYSTKSGLISWDMLDKIIAKIS